MGKTREKRRVAVGSDHGGYELKEQIAGHLRERGFVVEDCGAHGTEAVDYPTFAHAVASLVSTGKADCGIMVDRAGIGSAMAANKLPGVRAALCYDLSSARNSREHNNANVLTVGSGLIGPDLALQIVDTWLATECTAERHLRRARMIEPGSSAAGGKTHDDEERMENLTDQDLDRIAKKIAELSGTPGAAGCANPACACCQGTTETTPENNRELVGMGAARVGHRPGAGSVPDELAKYIDHTLLRPDATQKEIIDLCAEARQYHFASVCVNPTYTRLCADQLRGSSVRVCSVVGFPLGTHLPEIKGLEARRAIRDGAREIDMVINVGAVKSGDRELLYRDMRAVTDACIEGGAICKIILETVLLSDEEKYLACQVARRAGADFVKTSTGFGGGGATAHDVALMAAAVRGSRMGVKASGGIRSFEDASKMIQAGATRLGVSAGIKIIKESKGLTVSDGADQKY